VSPSPGRRPSGRRGLLAGLRHNAPAVLGATLLLAGLWALPDLSPEPTMPPPVDLAHGRITEILPASHDPALPNVRVLILAGRLQGQTLEAVVQGPAGEQEVPTFEAGDEVVVSLSEAPDGIFVAVSDRYRVPLFAMLLVLFAVGVMVVGGWRGLRSLLALALTLGVVVKLVVPLLLAGWDPVLLAVMAAFGVTAATVLLTEGLRRSSIAAIGGTLAALSLTALLAQLVNGIADFSQFQGQEAAIFLQSLGIDVDIRGLLLAAVIFGALGVLDDVTVTQAATVSELAEADPTARPRVLIGRAMNVGRSHIAATVNTLVLAYVGASLPLIVLFAAGGADPLLTASGELVAVEIARALVGSIGIVAAVPFTTVVAVGLIELRWFRWGFVRQ
jgi:uncharacterized membrane protein